jgi:hypothetical protein
MRDILPYLYHKNNHYIRTSPMLGLLVFLLSCNTSICFIHQPEQALRQNLECLCSILMHLLFSDQSISHGTLQKNDYRCLSLRHCKGDSTRQKPVLIGPLPLKQ